MTNPTPTPHVTIYAAIGQRIRTQREAAGMSVRLSSRRSPGAASGDAEHDAEHGFALGDGILQGGRRRFVLDS